MATNTPWGPSHYSKPYGRGVVQYGCAGHGGYHVSKTRIDSLPDAVKAALKRAGWVERKGDAWFEEDDQWSVLPVVFPALFSQEQITDGEKILRNDHPDIWEAVHGRKLTPEESRVRATEHFHEIHKDDLIGIAAWGSDGKHIPEGMVAVCALKNGHEGHRNPENKESYWLVPEKEYNDNRVFGFVIDASRHTPSKHNFGPTKRAN